MADATLDDCTSCGTSDEACRQAIHETGRGCCGACFIRDTHPTKETTVTTIDEMNEGVRQVRRRRAVEAEAATATVDDVQEVRQAKALLELREAARAHAGITDTDARQVCEEAIGNRIATAFDNGATMAQVAAVMADGARINREHRQRLRRITGTVPAGYGGKYDHTATMDELLDDLERAVEANRQVIDQLTAQADELRQLKGDVAAMRRVLGVAAD